MSYSNFRWLIERITQLKSHETHGLPGYTGIHISGALPADTVPDRNIPGKSRTEGATKLADEKNRRFRTSVLTVVFP